MVPELGAAPWVHLMKPAAPVLVPVKDGAEIPPVPVYVKVVPSSLARELPTVVAAVYFDRTLVVPEETVPLPPLTVAQVLSPRRYVVLLGVPVAVRSAIATPETLSVTVPAELVQCKSPVAAAPGLAKKYEVTLVGAYSVIAVVAEDGLGPCPQLIVAATPLLVPWKACAAIPAVSKQVKVLAVVMPSSQREFAMLLAPVALGIYPVVRPLNMLGQAVIQLAPMQNCGEVMFAKACRLVRTRLPL